VVRLVNEKFIPVAVDARRERARKDAVGELVRTGDWVTITASGKTTVVTASGKMLGNVAGISEKHRLASLASILTAWDGLPETERNLGKIDLGQPDAGRPLAQPPAGALVVRVWNRQFERETDGRLRYTEAEDYPEKDRGSAGRYRESAQDTMWIPETEWKALLPEKPEKGRSFPAPDSFVLRLFKYHLDPERVLGEGVTFGGARAGDGKVTLTVEEMTPETIRLRLDGSARLAQKRPDGKQTVYEPALLGYLTCSARDRTVTRFEMVALGDVTNTPRGVRPGVHPLGIAFDLVSRPTVAERVVPRGGRDNVQRYLEIASTGK
jgi:hypothetical protein